MSLRTLTLLFIFLCADTLSGQISGNSITASPNPCVNRSLISFTLASSDTVTLKVLNMLGQDIALLRSNIYLTAGAYQDSLKLDNFPDGIYMVFLSVKTETKPVAYKLVKSAIAEIPTVSALSLFNVYPNPVLDKINIDFGDTKTEQVKLQINNSLGQVVYFADGVTPEQKIDLGFLSRGIYFLKIQNNSELRNYKIVKE